MTQTIPHPPTPSPESGKGTFLPIFVWRPATLAAIQKSVVSAHRLVLAGFCHMHQASNAPGPLPLKEGGERPEIVTAQPGLKGCGKNGCWASGGYPPDAQDPFFPNTSMTNSADRRTG